MKEVKYCFSFTYDPARLHTRSKKIVVPGDLKGAKVRPSHGTFAAWMVSLGATNVQAGPAETRDLVDKGVVDTLTSPWGSMLLFGLEKVTKYSLDRDDVPLNLSRQLDRTSIKISRWVSRRIETQLAERKQGDRS